MPTVIVAVVLAIILIGFYIADRSSGGSPNVSSITHSAGTDKKIAQKAKYERSKSVFEHAGFSGSMEDYLRQSKDGFEDSANSPMVKEHTGYSGSGEEYVERFEEITDKELKDNAAEHAGYSGSIDDYLAGNYDKQEKKYSPKHPRDGATQDSGASNKGYTGSMGEYMKKYGG
jgi:hypothetical protein